MIIFINKQECRDNLQFALDVARTEPIINLEPTDKERKREKKIHSFDPVPH